MDREQPFYAGDFWLPHTSEYSCHRPHPDDERYPNGEMRNTISGEPELRWWPEDRDFG